MNKLDNNLWRFGTVMKFTYTKTREDFTYGAVATLLTALFIFMFSGVLSAVVSLFFFIYLVENYTVANRYVQGVIDGGRNLGATEKTIETILEKPWEFMYEIQQCHDARNMV